MRSTLCTLEQRQSSRQHLTLRVPRSSAPPGPVPCRGRPVPRQEGDSLDPLSSSRCQHHVCRGRDGRLCPPDPSPALGSGASARSLAAQHWPEHSRGSLGPGRRVHPAKEAHTRSRPARDVSPPSADLRPGLVSSPFLGSTARGRTQHLLLPRSHVFTAACAGPWPTAHSWSSAIPVETQARPLLTVTYGHSPGGPGGGGSSASVPAPHVQARPCDLLQGSEHRGCSSGRGDSVGLPQAGPAGSSHGAPVPAQRGGAGKAQEQRPQGLLPGASRPEPSRRLGCRGIGSRLGDQADSGSRVSPLF